MSNIESRYRSSLQQGGVESAPVRTSSATGELGVAKGRDKISNKSASKFLPRNKLKFSLLVLIVATLAFVLFRFVTNSSSSSVTGVKKDYYQAVFLIDGTQYVGRLTSQDSGHYKLMNVYFVSSAEQPIVSDSSSAQTTGQVSLTKLEAGLLNAENEMIIPKDKVLFYENLKPDGQAAKLLDRNKSE